MGDGRGQANEDHGARRAHPAQHPRRQGPGRSAGRLKYFLDANVIVHIANDVPDSDRMYARIVEQPKGRVLLSAITAHEIRFMAVRAKAPAKQVARLQALAHDFPVIEFDLPAAHAAADVRAQLEAAGKPLGVYDMLLAGHARREGAVVVTDDGGFKHVPGLHVENWLR
ncbi:MAG: PIN domain-containing protein [Betaproteobacteria bacterium]